MPPLETEVLIVGGGPTGLTAALLLARLGIEVIVLERRDGTSTHPKATIVNTRTMELFRLWGIEDEVRDAGLSVEHGASIVWVSRLAGERLGALSLTDDAERLMELMSKSATLPCVCPQHRIEAILKHHAAAADLRFGIELVDFTQLSDGVVATALDRASGERLEIRARYMIGADGPLGPTRELLGICLKGDDRLAQVVNIHFDADLGRWLQDEVNVLTWVVNRDLRGVIHALDGSSRWLLNTLSWLDGDQLEERDLTREAGTRLVRQAIGDPECVVDVLSIKPWTMRALIADRFQAGRVFLAGDAAHQIPPTGGFGMNTGIQDVHNLAWKLAAVLRRWAAPSLLETYEPERRPVAEANIAQSVTNAVMMKQHIAELDGAELEAIECAGERGEAVRAQIARGIPAHRRHFDYPGLDLGFSYASSAVVPDGSDRPVVDDPVRDYAPSARPGARAPHMWLRREGKEISSLDLFDDAFVVLTGPAGDRWRRAALELAERASIPLRAYTLADDGDLEDVYGELAALYGIASDGAVMVRPDGHVAWRSRSADPRASERLSAVLRELIGSEAPVAA